MPYVWTFCATKQWRLRQDYTAVSLCAKSTHLIWASLILAYFRDKKIKKFWTKFAELKTVTLSQRFMDCGSICIVTSFWAVSNLHVPNQNFNFWDINHNQRTNCPVMLTWDLRLSYYKVQAFCLINAKGSKFDLSLQKSKVISSVLQFWKRWFLMFFTIYGDGWPFWSYDLKGYRLQI